MENLHHTTIAHFRRAMLMEESNVDIPPVIDFSFYADCTSDIQAADVGFTDCSSLSYLAEGRDTAPSVWGHVLRTLHSTDKNAEFMQSVICEQQTFNTL